MSEKISQEEAVERLRESDSAILITLNGEPVPVIGKLENPQDAKITYEVKTFEIGDVPGEFKSDAEG